MAIQVISSPVIRDAVWNNITFQPLANDIVDITLAGVEHATRITPVLWRVQAQSPPKNFAADLYQLQSRLDFHRSERIATPLYDRRRASPFNYRDNLLDDSSARLTGLGAGNTQLSLTGLPANTELLAGDYVEILRANPLFPQWRSLHRLVNPVTIGANNPAGWQPTFLRGQLLRADITTTMATRSASRNRTEVRLYQREIGPDIGVLDSGYDIIVSDGIQMQQVRFRYPNDDPPGTTPQLSMQLQGSRETGGGLPYDTALEYWGTGGPGRLKSVYIYRDYGPVFSIEIPAADIQSNGVSQNRVSWDVTAMPVDKVAWLKDLTTNGQQRHWGVAIADPGQTISYSATATAVPITVYPAASPAVAADLAAPAITNPALIFNKASANFQIGAVSLSANPQAPDIVRLNMTALEARG